MERQNRFPKTAKTFLTSKAVFTITIIVVVLTVLGIWLFGLGQRRTIFENSILSTSILSIGFFLFLTIGLYHGIKLKENIGRLTDKINLSNLPDFPSTGSGGGGADSLELGEGIGEIFIAVILWIVVTFLIGIFLWIFGAILWAGIIAFVAMLYWIFFRALRLVFKNAPTCRGNLTKSIGYGLFYTTLYNFWIYGIILATHYLIK